MADFIIPLRREELLRSSSNNYFVEEILPQRILATKIQECKASFRTNGPQAIQNCFPTFYSVLEYFNRLEPFNVEEAWKIILNSGLQAFVTQVSDALQRDMDTTTRRSLLNTMKMITYIVCQMMELAESAADAGNALNIAPVKGRKKAVKQSAADTQVISDWEEQRERALNLLVNLLQTSIQRLWDPPVAEEEFVSLVTNACYRLLEKPAVVKKVTTRDAICWLLGTAVSKYNHGLSCSIKLIQLLQLFEHLAPFVALAVSTFATEFNFKTVASDMIREISRMSPSDLAKDTSGTRSYAAFLVELAEKVPAVMLPNISLLLSLLDGESYSMRNSVLTILGELIIRVLSDEKMDDKQRAARESFLDKLEDHIYDVSAFVRSKALQIWYRIASEKALPLNRQHAVLHLAVDRLVDKSSQVRKGAMQLVTILIQSNPFATKVPLATLKSTLDEEQKKLSDLAPAPKPSNITDELEDQWQRVAREVKAAVRAAGDADEEAGDDGGDTLLTDDDTAERVFEKIATHMKSGRYEDAVKLFNASKSVYPNAKPFTVPCDDDSEGTAAKVKATVLGLKLIYLGDAMTTGAIASSAGAEENDKANEVAKQQVVVEYLKDSVSFLCEVERVFPAILQLLFSKVTSDVLEAVEFFVTAHHCGLAEAEAGIRRMLPLVWSKEGDVANAVVEAYRKIFLSTDGAAGKSKNIYETVATNLISLTLQIPIEDASSLQQLVQHLMLSGDISQKTLQSLWDRVVMKTAGCTAAESRAALILMTMAASEDCNVARSRLDAVITECLAKRTSRDLMFGREVCAFVRRAQPTKRGGVTVSNSQEPYRLSEHHKLFTVISEQLVTNFERTDVSQWLPLVEEAINAVYTLAEHPDVICGQVLKDLANKLLADGASQETGEAVATKSVLLSRFVFAVGHVALRQLLHLEVDMFGELKRRQAVVEGDKDLKKAGKGGTAALSARRTSAVGASSRKKTSQADDKEADNLDEEMGLAGAAAEDAEAEAIRKVAEMELVTGGGLISTLQGVIVALCAHHIKHSDVYLATTATLALSKLMVVSSKFCDAHLQLLFTVLEKSASPHIRANTIIALGDLAFRFPNLIEPWTSHLYARLRDGDAHVRRTTLLVLSRLILHDMIKVKGQISEMACCIIDSNSEISGLAKAFFHELSQKGNAIYNIMPDMVSRMSDAETGIQDEESFRVTMKYLFSFIQKDKQCESLVEKLCHRFEAARSERQHRDLAFCLAQLSYSDKSLQKLHENFAHFADKLASKDVYDSLMSVINGAKKFAKPETKSLVDELEDMVTKCHEKGVEDVEATQKAAKASTTARTARAANAKTARGGKRGGRSTAAPRRAVADEDEDEEDVEPETPKPQFKVPKRPQGQGRGRGKTKIVDSDSDSDDLELSVNSTPRAIVDDDDKENGDITVLSPEPRPIKRKNKNRDSLPSTPEIVDKAASRNAANRRKIR